MKQNGSKLETILTTVPLKVHDDSLKENAENASGVGLEVRVSREYDGVGVHNGKDVCLWCLSRCGENMTLQEAYWKGSFQRHEGCGCLIEYVSKRGVKTYQTGKSGPNDWLLEEEFNRRVNYGIEEREITPQERIINAAIEMQMRDKKSLTLVDAIIDNHEALQYYTPEGMKRRLEQAGYKVTALKKGALKDKPFEEGGGYIINFGGDGAFQYHPAEHSHHGGAYWKVKNGPTGKGGRHYDMGGNEIKYP